MGLKTRIRKLLGHAPAAIPSEPTPDLETLAARYPDMPREFLQTFRDVQPYTMTSPERVFALCDAVRHVVRNQIPGDLVECGVWRGGSTMAMLKTLSANSCDSRLIWLYDTFEGMSEPGQNDVDCYGQTADRLLEQSAENRTAADSVWCEASLDDVRTNVSSCAYPQNHLNYIVGKVEQTIPASLPDKIALLRLDTDWFDSTWHELVHLYPRLVPGGILIIDDYGHWQGCREAVDQYLQQHAPNLLLCRIDYTGRIAVKP